MNKKFIKLDNESYAINIRNGELNNKDSSIDNLDNILSLENNIEKLYDELKKCNKNIATLNFRIKDKIITYKLLLIFMFIFPLVVLGDFESIGIKEYFINYGISYLFTTLPIGVILTVDTSVKGTLKSIKTEKIINEENKQKILGEIKTKQKKLTELKNDINYFGLDLNKTNNLKNDIDYGYKFQPKIVDEIFCNEKQVKAKVLKND